VPDLNPALQEQTANQSQGPFTCLRWVGFAEVETCRVDDLPQADIVRMALVGQAFQDILGRHWGILVALIRE
jgi:hypothetical protein